MRMKSCCRCRSHYSGSFNWVCQIEWPSLGKTQCSNASRLIALIPGSNNRHMYVTAYNRTIILMNCNYTSHTHLNRSSRTRWWVCGLNNFYNNHLGDDKHNHFTEFPRSGDLSGRVAAARLMVKASFCVYISAYDLKAAVWPLQMAKLDGYECASLKHSMFPWQSFTSNRRR